MLKLPLNFVIVQLILCAGWGVSALAAERLPPRTGISAATYPVKGLTETLQFTDPQFAQQLIEELQAANVPLNTPQAAPQVQAVLDRHALFAVAISPESRVKVDLGAADHNLIRSAWRTYLIKVVNDALLTAPLAAESKHFAALDGSSTDPDRWLSFRLVDDRDAGAQLGGRRIEYRVVRVATDELGKRAAVVAMNVGEGTQDIGFRNDVLALFTSSTAAKETTPPITVAEQREPPLEARPPSSEEDLQQWLHNMVGQHRYSIADVCRATGLAESAAQPVIDRVTASHDQVHHTADEPLHVAPFPGGRHPRIGFLDGAIFPQRETKISIFCPWDTRSYVVVDVPEAIFSNLGLMYLAHTHVPTLWDRQGVKLAKQEWRQESDGRLTIERKLPNQVSFGAEVSPSKDLVQMELWLKNGTPQTLTDLRVQSCVMLREAAGFTTQTNRNKVFQGPYAAVRNEAGDRWIITAWTRPHHVWGNAECPCLHSDPQFDDCPPGEMQRLRGFVSFYSGTDLEQELQRLTALGWDRPTDR
jgi:hypothetical protein